MKLITKAQSIFSLIILPLISLSSLFGQTIDLGTLSASNINAFRVSADMPPEEAFNGISTGESEGWLASSTSPQTLSWDINPFQNTQIDTSAYNQVQFTLRIYTGIGVFENSDFGELQNFYLRVADANDDFDTVVTSYDSLSTLQVSDSTALSISSDSSGLITSANSDGQALHTIVFTAAHTTRRIQLESTSDATTDPAILYSIEEIETSAVAIPVPEPSTFALLLGASVIGFGILLRKP